MSLGGIRSDGHVCPLYPRRIRIFRRGRTDRWLQLVSGHSRGGTKDSAPAAVRRPNRLSSNTVRSINGRSPLTTAMGPHCQAPDSGEKFRPR